MGRRAAMVVVPAAVAALAAGCAGDAAAPLPASARDANVGGPTGPVTRVVDGDTIHVRATDRDVVVRLLGIDTPEVHPHAECYGREATDLTRRLLPLGTVVRVDLDRSQGPRDRFGRTLGYVRPVARAGTGTGSVNRDLVEAGAARVFVRRRAPFTYAREFLRAERVARDERRGMWGAACGR